MLLNNDFKNYFYKNYGQVDSSRMTIQISLLKLWDLAEVGMMLLCYTLE